ncbi:MAG: hypothetical protein M3Q58_14275 [Bacteroidota bacterium]|nr:hypothetical protein [Bacteroidota bacterium]
MNNALLHVIFPKDGTTDFLEEIIDYLKNQTKAIITVHRINDLEQQLDFKSNIGDFIPINSNVLFIGHGTSSSLRGPVVPLNSFGPFFSESELSLFKTHRIILLTCRSSDYLKKYGKESGLKAGIGFPNLITDYYEIIYPEDPHRVTGLAESEIILFRNVLVDIVKFSLEEFINGNLSFFQLYKRIKLRSQKALIKFYNRNHDKGKLPYGKMLYDLNDGLGFIGN